MKGQRHSEAIAMQEVTLLILEASFHAVISKSLMCIKYTHYYLQSAFAAYFQCDGFMSTSCTLWLWVPPLSGLSIVPLLCLLLQKTIVFCVDWNRFCEPVKWSKAKPSATSLTFKRANVAEFVSFFFSLIHILFEWGSFYNYYCCIFNLKQWSFEYSSCTDSFWE